MTKHLKVSFDEFVSVLKKVMTRNATGPGEEDKRAYGSLYNKWNLKEGQLTENFHVGHISSIYKKSVWWLYKNYKGVMSKVLPVE